MRGEGKRRERVNYLKNTLFIVTNKNSKNNTSTAKKNQNFAGFVVTYNTTIISANFYDSD